jgi:Lipocalin-like domain
MHACRSLVVVAALFASATIAGRGLPTKTSTLGRQTASASPDLKGAWKIVEQSARSPNGDWTVGATPHLSLYIFTDKHYSYMFAPGLAPRRLFAGDPNQPTDAEKVAAYNSFVAGSGTYTLTGSTLMFNAVLHKNPNEMNGHPLRYEVEILGSTLRMTIANPPFAPGLERRTLLTRVE